MSNPSTIDSPDWSVHPDNSSKFNDLWRQLQKLNIQQSAPPQHSFSAEEFVEINPTSQGIWSSQQPINSLPNIEVEITTQNLYKTELCRSFEETGTCRYSSKCQFAHGRSELRPVLRHPKYKTEVCKTFHTIGTCPYGKRCRFIHISPDIFLEDDPLPLNEPTAISTPPTTTTITTTTKIPIHNPYVPPLTPQRTSQPINYMSMTPISQEKEKKKYDFGSCQTKKYFEYSCIRMEYNMEAYFSSKYQSNRTRKATILNAPLKCFRRFCIAYRAKSR